MKTTTNLITIKAAADAEKAARLAKKWAAKEKAARALLELDMDALNTDILLAGDYLITRSTSTYRALNQKRLKAEHPEIVEAYTEQKPRRHFNVDKTDNK